VLRPNGEQLLYSLVRLLPAPRHGLKRALLQVIADELPRNAFESFLNGSDLHEDVGATTVLLDHLLQTADLAFDSPQPKQVGRLHVRFSCASA